MGYSKAETRRIDFSEWEESDLWVDIRVITEMPYAEYLDVWVTEHKDEPSQIVRRLSAMVIAWNLTGPDGEVLPIPKEDPSSVGKVRTRHAEYIAQEILVDSQLLLDLDLVKRTRPS